ncbi:DMT family transporter [Thalassotalea euphylliae]|uniref:DMT family transporter n=2 Tax=Thalassotalea euphylliae TaxID=1655234 RepID=A0A3E0UB60_9GAMM|nr:DMT family transporter [Thalassotalea euphylliae]
MASILGSLALFMWSSLALLAAKTTNIPAFFILSCAFFVSFGLSLLWRYQQEKHWFASPKLTVKQWLFGIVGLFGYHFCYFFALQFAPVLEVTLINYLWPLLLTLLLAQRGQRLFALSGGITAFIGIVVLLSGGQATFTQQDLVGYLLALGAAIIWASYSAYLSKGKSNTADIGWLSLAVALLAAICHLLFEPAINIEQLTTVKWLYLLLIGLGPLGGSFYLWEYGLSKGNHRLLASLSFFTPLCASLLLAIFAMATWSIEMAAALTLILLGGLITHMPSVLDNYRQRLSVDKVTS